MRRAEAASARSTPAHRFLLAVPAPFTTILQASFLHSVEAHIYPLFLQSYCFELYSQMQYFAFTRPALSKHKFVWLKVRSQ